MKTILYEIPDSYFPGYRIRVPFRVKVRYEILNGKVNVMELCFSPDCLRCISNIAGLTDQIERELNLAEKSKHVHPTIVQSLKPFLIESDKGLYIVIKD